MPSGDVELRVGSFFRIFATSRMLKEISSIEFGSGEPREGGVLVGQF
jgi:hypothetical protein